MDYDVELDTVFLFLGGCPVSHVAHYIGDGLHELRAPGDWALVGYMVEDWQTRFVPKHPELASGVLSIDIGGDDDGCQILESKQLLIYGEGRDMADAIVDFCECFIEYVELVEAGAKRGDPFDIDTLAEIHKCFRRINAN